MPFVAPADFIQNDGHPNDDQQHGTHIASLIASTSTQYPGIAPGVTIIPVKVLNAQNAGTEWALVEGIRHAVANGAKVINMSLSFPLGYVPSPALQDALEAASAANVVMVRGVRQPGRERAHLAGGEPPRDLGRRLAHRPTRARRPRRATATADRRST